MTQKLILSIVTPEKQLVSEEVDQVNVPGTEGDLGILHDHAPILTLLRTGQLSYEKEGETIFMVVSGGYLEVTDNRVTVLAETGEFLHEIDRERAERARGWAKLISLMKNTSKRRRNCSALSPASKILRTTKLPTPLF